MFSVIEGVLLKPLTCREPRGRVAGDAPESEPQVPVSTDDLPSTILNLTLDLSCVIRTTLPLDSVAT